MLKDARSIPVLDARERAEPWPTGWAFLSSAKHRVEAGWSKMQGRWRLRAILLVISCVAAGAIGGSIAGASMAGRSAHQKGACAALHMAAAHGYMDERQQRVVMRTLATTINPDVEFFPGGYRALRDICGLNGGRS